VRRTLLAATGLLIAVAHSLSGQTPTRPGPGAPPPSGNGEVRGIVVDAKSTSPVARASVAVRPKGTTTLIAGAIANAEGVFRVQGLRPGEYTARVTFLGFTPKIQEFTITAAAPLSNLGNVALTRAAVELDKIAVVEERDAVTIEPDRNSYRAKDVAPAAANASEVLEATPSVEVDGDGKVSLRGNENVAVQINGRPSPIRGTQLAAYLKSLPANILDRVEVIPNPSAKHDPEGMAGIINIVLKSNVDLGISAGLTLGAANANRYNGSGNFGYQAGRITSFTNFGVNLDERDIVGVNDRERLDALRAILSVTEQDIDGSNRFAGQNFTTNLDYKLNARDVLTNAFAFNHRDGRDASLSAYSELNGSRALIDRYDRPRNAGSKGMMFDYTMAFKRTLEARKHELGAEVRFNRAHDEDNTSLWRQVPTAPGASTTRLDGQNDDVDALTKSLTAQADYTRTIGKSKLETGYKGNARWLERDYDVLKDALGTGAWVRSNLSNAFEFDETVHAAYGVLSRGVGKFELQGGLRAEYADRDFSLKTEAKSYPFDYTSFFPSGVVSYNLTQSSQAKASYSRRIRRPGTQELNPFPAFMDVQNVFVGNPALLPEYTDAYELGYTRSGKLGSLQLSPFYRRTSNVIRVVIKTDDVIDGREVTSVNFQNLAVSNSWGSDVNGSLRLGKRLNGFAGFNVYKMVTDGGSTSSLGSNAVTWSGRLNGTTEITPTLSFQASYFYRAPMKIERGEFAAFQMTNLSLRKKIDGDKSSLSVRFSDPFNTGRFRVKAGDDDIIQLTERRFGAQAVFVTYQYNYGQAPRVRQPRQEEAPPPSAFP
jgi:outer membrane receptor protein involved in Fe transport